MAHAGQRISRIPVCTHATRDTDDVVARNTTTIWSGKPCTDKTISWHIRSRSSSAGLRDLCPCHRPFRHPHLCQTPPPCPPAQAPGATSFPILPHSNEPLDSAEHNIFHMLNTLPLLPRALSWPTLRQVNRRRPHGPLYCTVALPITTIPTFGHDSPYSSTPLNSSATLHQGPIFFCPNLSLP